MAEAILDVRIRARDNEAEKELRKIRDQLADLKSAGTMVGTTLIAAGAAGAAGLGLALNAAGKFDSKMREVNTMLNLGEQEFQEFKGDVADAAATLGIDLVDAAKAMYQIISAGVPRENAVEFLQVATKSAIGGVTDLTVSVDGLTTVVNAFKKPLSETNRVADLMFTAVRRGKTTFNELSASMSTVAPLAASLDLDFEDITAAAATLTKQGIVTSDAMTQVRQSIIALMKPTNEMTDLIKASGYENGTAMLQTLGYAESMIKLREAAHGNNEVLATAFGRVQGLNAMLAMTGENADVARADLDAMRSSTGAATTAFEQMERGSERMKEAIVADFNAIMTTVGENFLPMMHDTMRDVRALTMVFREWADEHPALITNLGILTAASTALLVPLGATLIVVPRIISGLVTMRLALYALTGTTLGARAAVIALYGSLAVLPAAAFLAAEAVTHLSGQVNILHSQGKLTFGEQILSWVNNITGMTDAMAQLEDAQRRYIAYTDTATSRIYYYTEAEVKAAEADGLRVTRLEQVSDATITATDVQAELNAVLADGEALAQTFTDAYEDVAHAGDTAAEAFNRLLQQLQYNESEASAFGLTMQDIYDYMWQTGHGVEELERIFNAYGEETAATSEVLDKLGLNVQEVALFVGKLTSNVKTSGYAMRDVQSDITSLRGAVDQLNDSYASGAEAISAYNRAVRDLAGSGYRAAGYESQADYFEHLAYLANTLPEFRASREYSDEMRRAETVDEWGVADLVKALERWAKRMGVDLTKMADGGVINETVFGLGLSSGRGYMFGEAGPERVTPMRGGEGALHVHVEIDGHEVGRAVIDDLGKRCRALGL